MAEEHPINYAKSTQQIRPDNLPPPPPLLLQRTPVISSTIASNIVHQAGHQGNRGADPANQMLSHPKGDLIAHPVERHESNLKEKYAQLLSMIDDMSRDLRQSYAGSKTSTERLKRSMNQAKVLVHDLINESERKSIK